MNKYKSKKSISFLSFLVLVVLGGCAGVAPTRLAPEIKIPPVMLDQAYEYIAEFPGSQKMRVTLTAGRYIAVASDGGGLYYVGPKLCYRSVYIDPGWIRQRIGVGNHLAIADCGIYVPNDEAKFAHAFAIVGTFLSLEQMKEVDANISSNQRATETGIVPLEALPPIPAGVSPLQAGAGVGIGMGIAYALIAAEEGRFVALRNQEESLRLRRMVRPVAQDQ